jgi:hypothetical protein
MLASVLGLVGSKLVVGAAVTSDSRLEHHCRCAVARDLVDRCRTKPVGSNQIFSALENARRDILVKAHAL